MPDTLPTDSASAGAPVPARAVARIVGRSAFEAALENRCALLADSPNASSAAFTVLLLRLRRRDRRIKLLATEGADIVLREVLQRVAGVLHSDDLVTACSRDEVGVLLAKVGQEGVARLACDRILRALGRMSQGAALRPQIGAALAPLAGRTIEQILSAVDVACEAAATAHARVVFASFDMADHDDDAHLPALQRALQTNELELAFQPQFDLVRSTWSAVEALIRWPHAPGEAPLSPPRLVDLAERHGLMDGLTRLVLNTAMREAASLDDQGAQLDLAVNLSPSMMADGGLPERVAQALAAWHLAPGRLVLEVTENSIVRDGDSTLSVMRKLAALGTRLSIDDFGTGHSSFARMRDMPLTELKIDRLFIASMMTRREDMQIVRSVIDLAHNFDLRAVAEGVEDAATFAMLRGMGCDAVQGYFCARPMSADELAHWWPARPRTGFESR
ncbi:MAG TPA: GGDEF domain-containing phosphodiesterase [Burkholderiaceae bacterium]|nr:GGDEF domain-containing phosphodiesterase [Burkholderiaceae bacterium]